MKLHRHETSLYARVILRATLNAEEPAAVTAAPEASWMQTGDKLAITASAANHSFSPLCAAATTAFPGGHSSRGSNDRHLSHRQYRAA